jgi:hypothetical protein
MSETPSPATHLRPSRVLGIGTTVIKGGISPRGEIDPKIPQGGLDLESEVNRK